MADLRDVPPSAPDHLKPVRSIDEPDQDVIRMCQMLLGLAVEGELRALAFVTVKKGGYVGEAWTEGTLGPGAQHQLISGTAILQARLVANRSV